MLSVCREGGREGGRGKERCFCKFECVFGACFVCIVPTVVVIVFSPPLIFMEKKGWVIR